MRRIWHETPCGAMWRFNQYSFEDMVSLSMMRKLPKEDLEKLVDPSSTGRKKKLTAQRAYSKLVRLFWKKVIDRLMESDRFLIDDEISMYIGRLDKDVNQVTRKNYKPHLGWLNTHGVILNGFFHNYYFRMPGRRRRELRARLKKGQSFIV